MAYKKYGYFVKGNKIALIEQNVSASSSGTLAVAHCSLGGAYTTKDTCEAAGGQWIPSSGGFSSEAYEKYSSPIESITDGLEIEYTYSPIYRSYSNAVVNVDKFYVNGWTVIDGYLAFCRNYLLEDCRWDTAPEDAVTSGTAGDTGGQTGLDYIIVGGSSRWNGLHRVKTASAEGTLTTYTRVESTLPYWENKDIDFTTGEIAKDGGSDKVYLGNNLSDGDYIFISGVGTTTQNNGFFRIGEVTPSSTATSSTIKVDQQYAVVQAENSTTSSTGVDNEYTQTPVWGNREEENNANIYKAERDFCYILTNVSVINDESFDIDLPPYLCKALVYYVKAKDAEFNNKIDIFQYNMTEFKRMMEQHRSSKDIGPKMIQGFWGMR